MTCFNFFPLIADAEKPHEKRLSFGSRQRANWPERGFSCLYFLSSFFPSLLPLICRLLSPGGQLDSLLTSLFTILSLSLYLCVIWSLLFIFMDFNLQNSPVCIFPRFRLLITFYISFIVSGKDLLFIIKSFHQSCLITSVLLYFKLFFSSTYFSIFLILLRVFILSCLVTWKARQFNI